MSFDERKDLQFIKCMVQSRNPGEGRAVFSWRRENCLTHIFDPYWIWAGRLTEERKYVLALLSVPKHRSKKRIWNRCNANCGKWNLKRLGMCHESKFSGKGGLFGWPIARPHSWPMFWPIRDYHTMDWADFIGFMTSGFSVKKREKPLKCQGKLDFLQLITRRS